ncbi:TraY domain-containing protein [Serratia marcescens]
MRPHQASGSLLRLEDHLNEFVDIASAGKRFAR